MWILSNATTSNYSIDSSIISRIVNFVWSMVANKYCINEDTTSIIKFTRYKKQSKHFSNTSRFQSYQEINFSIPNFNGISWIIRDSTTIYFVVPYKDQNLSCSQQSENVFSTECFGYCARVLLVFAPQHYWRLSLANSVSQPQLFHAPRPHATTHLWTYTASKRCNTFTILLVIL